MSNIIPLNVKYNKSGGSINTASKKMRESNPCKNAGFPNQYLSFE
jgi:hypothetical protein